MADTEEEVVQKKKKVKKEPRQSLLLLDSDGSTDSNSKDDSVEMKIQKTTMKSINETTVDPGNSARKEVNKYFEKLRAKLSVDTEKYDSNGNRTSANELIRQSVLTRKIQSNANDITSEKKVKSSIGYTM